VFFAHILDESGSFITLMMLIIHQCTLLLSLFYEESCSFMVILVGIFLNFQMIMEKKFQPVIIFSFSKKSCKHHAKSISKLDFNTQEEKDTVLNIFEKAVLTLNEEDRSLSAIKETLPFLQRGIGIHHSGLLPVIKELVFFLIWPF